MKRRAVILTGHFPLQKRRANIPWLADHMRADGWHVTFVTVGYSWVSRIRRDRRFQSLDAAPVPGERQIDDSLTAIFGYAPIHPFSLGHWPDRLLHPFHALFARYWTPILHRHVARADLIVIESGPPLLLAPAVRRAAPQVPMVYRASDDIRLLGLPAFMAQAEIDNAPLFDRISVASPRLAARWTGHPGLEIDPIGVPRAQLEQHQPDPYAAPRARIEAVCAGTTLFDMGQAVAIATACPDWRLHVIGRLKTPPRANTPTNLIIHGERSFDETVAYIRHADIGMAIYRDQPGVEYQTAQSNRMLLYRYFRLPIIGPDRLCDPDIPLIIGYDAADAGSIRRAATVAEALRHSLRDGRADGRADGRENGPRGGGPDPEIPDWSLLYQRIISTRRQVQ